MAKYEGPQITSSEFRRTYAKIGTPTMVTVNGHVIGVWVPSNDGISISIKMDTALRQYGDPDPFDSTKFGQGGRIIEVTAQSQRDAILRRINKGG